MRTENTSMDPVLKADMQAACDRIAKGILPTMAERKAAATRIDRMTEPKGWETIAPAFFSSFISP